MDDNLFRFNKTSKIGLIDFETEGLALFLPLNRPWQVSMLDTVGDQMINSQSFFIKWDTPLKVSPGAAKVTNFDAKKVESLAVSYQEIVPKVVNWCESQDYILGQNLLGFDIYFLNWFYEFCGKDSRKLVYKILDTHALLKGLKLGCPFNHKKYSLPEYQYSMINIKAKGIKTNLTAIGQEYKINFDYNTLHDAENDVKLNFIIWNKLKWQIDI